MVDKEEEKSLSIPPFSKRDGLSRKLTQQEKSRRIRMVQSAEKP